MADIFTPTTVKAGINSLRLFSGDCKDESIKLFSNFGESLRLKRSNRDDFSWDQNGLFVAKNLSEQTCTLQVHLLKCSGDFVIVRTSRGGSLLLKETDKHAFLLPGLCALTFRANNATGKGAANL
jgi:hypothetical protein